MKLNLRAQKDLGLTPDKIINKIILYLKKSDYKVIEKTDTTIIFDRDVYSARRSSSSDYYTKVDGGQIELMPVNQGTRLKLIYRVSVLTEFIFLSIIFIVGITIDFKALFLSIPFILNFMYKLYYIHTNILNNIFNG